MNLVVSNNMNEYNGFTKVRTLEEACKYVADGKRIDYLIYHKSNEKPDDKVKFLTELKDSVGKLIYIRSKDNYEVAVYMIVTGASGNYFSDEFFLSDGETLDSLLSDLSGATQLATMSEVSVVEDFFTRYIKNGGEDLKPSYLALVKESVKCMVEEYQAKNLELVQLSETATDLFSNSLKVLSGVEEEKLNLKKSLARLEEARESLSYSASTTGSIFFFPQVRYLKERKILRIKEYGHCNFLTSFLLGFKFYCATQKFLRPRLIFIYSVGSEYEHQYADYKWITQATSKKTDSYNGDVIFMNYPNEESFLRLLDDKEYNFSIVVDREKFSGKHILDMGTKSPLCYASGGVSALNREKIQLNSAFTNKAIDGTMFQIANDPEYPNDPEQRLYYYVQEYKAEYEMLLNYRGIIKKK